MSTAVRIENEQFFLRPSTVGQEQSPVHLISETLMPHTPHDYVLEYTIGPLTKLATLENTLIDLLEHLELSINVFSEFTDTTSKKE